MAARTASGHGATYMPAIADPRIQLVHIGPDLSGSFGHVVFLGLETHQLLTQFSRLGNSPAARKV